LAAIVFTFVVPCNMLKRCNLASRGLRSMESVGKRVPNIEQNVDRVNTVLGRVDIRRSDL